MDYSRLKSDALASLSGRWGLAIGTTIVLFLISLAARIVPGVGFIISLLVAGPLSVGMSRFYLNIALNEEARLENLFSAFNDKFWRAVGAYLLMGIYVLLWLLLLIVPGIIKAFAYSQVLYILAEDDNIGIEQALDKSQKMMDGYKMDLFILQLSFIGWAFLCIFTLGIGFLWLGPWISVSRANFYLEVKANYEGETEVVSPEDSPSAV